MKKLGLGIAVLLFAMSGVALAQNKLPVKWRYFVGCPVLADSVNEASRARSCTESRDAVVARITACFPAGTQIDVSGVCNTPSSTGGGISTLQPGGSWQVGSGNEAYCDGVVGPSFDSAIGLYCATTPYSRDRNAGAAKDCNCNQLEGNPFEPATGNKYQAETDYVGPGPFPLRFVRYYNSVLKNNSAGIGSAWTHSYNSRLVFDPTTSLNVVGAYREDGRTIAFNKSGGGYVGDSVFVEKLEQIANGWRLVNAADETELYDAAGNLLSITDRAGRMQTLAYDAGGRLLSVTDPFGRMLTITRNSVGRILSLTTPGPQIYSYLYSTDGRQDLVKVTYPDATTRIYHYELVISHNALTGITDENGQRFATFGYSGVYGGNIAISTEHAGGAGKITMEPFGVDSFGNRTSTVTRFVGASSSATRTYTYKNIQGVAVKSAVSGPACPTCGPTSQTYDANGNVATSVDWNGNRTNFAYELPRNLQTSRTEALTSAGAATPQTRTTTTEWHAAFRLVKRMAEPLRITSFIYHGDGGASCGAAGALCSKTVQATTDATGALGFGATPAGAPRGWSYTYNAEGQLLTAEGPRTNVADTTTYTYYANNDADLGKRGNVATITNAAGHTTQITAYNAHGQPLTIVDPNGLATTLTYDLRRRLKSRDVGGELTSYDYDNAGQLIKVTLPDGSFLSYSYDAAHRLTGIQDNLGNRVAYTLDLAGNRTQEQVFDPANALAQTRSRVYSNINRLFRELGAAAQTTEYAYDNQGNVTSVKDPLNKITSNQYDPLNRLKQVTDPALGVTQYAYNGLDALTQVTDPRSLVTGYTVDGLGNLMQQASPDTGNSVNSYDAAGNLATQTDAKGQATGYAYDALNRVTLITFHDGSKQAYAYDQGTNGIGRLSSITETDPANQVTSAIAYGYDQKGRVTSETRTVNGIAYALAYTFDGSGRLTGLTYPSGRTVAYTLDLLGRVNQVTTTKDAQSQIVVQNVQYHPFGGAKSWTLGNGQIYSRTVDQDGRVAGYTLGAANYAIGFDAASRITGISEVGNPANANTYGYDALDRLASAVLPGSNFAYGYDAAGNRLTKTIGANTDAYAYSATSNRIASLTPAGAPPRSFVFDANGSTTSDGLNTYAYDTRGRMVQAVSTAGTTSYQVNALGQRIRKTNGAGDTVFTYDTWGKLIAETDPGGTLKREYLYLGDIPVGVVQ